MKFHIIFLVFASILAVVNALDVTQNTSTLLSASFVASRSSLQQVYNSNTTDYEGIHSNDDEFIGQTIEYLIQEDEFHQLVILTDKPINDLQIYNQNENKEIANLYFKELNENILNIIVYEILEDLHIHTVVLLVEDALWKMVQQHIQTHIEKPILWIRLLHTLTPLKETSGDSCQFQMARYKLENAINGTANDLLTKITKAKQECTKNKQLTIKAVGVLEDYLFEDVHTVSDDNGKVHCKQDKYLCHKALDVQGEAWNLTCCAGLHADLAAKIFETLGYKWSLWIVPDNVYGGFTNCSNPKDHTTCQWNGMVEELRQGRADVAIAGMTITNARLEVMDFTEDIFVTRIAVALRNIPEKLSFVNWKFIESLDWSLLFALLVNLLIAVGVMYYLQKLVMRYKPDSIKYPIKESFSYGAGLTFQRDLAGKTPDNWSARTVAISYAVALTIIMSTYMANITASSVLSESFDDFKGLHDEKILNPTTDFKYGVADSRATGNLLKSSEKWAKPYSEFVTNYLTLGVADGIEKVNEGILDAYVEEYWHLTAVQGKKADLCENIIVRKETFVVSNAFGTRQNSQLTRILSNAIRDLKDKKVVDQLMEKWINKCSAAELRAFQFEYEYAGGMVILVLISLLIALVALALETLYIHWRDQNENKTRRRQAILQQNGLVKNMSELEKTQDGSKIHTPYKGIVDFDYLY